MRKPELPARMVEGMRGSLPVQITITTPEEMVWLQQVMLEHLSPKMEGGMEILGVTIGSGIKAMGVDEAVDDIIGIMRAVDPELYIPAYAQTFIKHSFRFMDGMLAEEKANPQPEDTNEPNQDSNHIP
jgi:hypothetical protein